ncbi:LysR substrate-binding domain-containing protein (Fragment) OS=Stutzerimonas stutzeri OX=316 GN=N5C32_22885 PE=4 SV=1 [Stutzerimonas stutzeri]
MRKTQPWRTVGCPRFPPCAPSKRPPATKPKQAAEEPSVTATAISHQIRSLEESLGVALFLRKPRKLELTAQGRELQQTLEAAFDSISATVERLSAKPCRQAITLSTTPAIAVRWLVPWLCLLRDSHPDIDLRFHTSHEPVALDSVTADIAIRYGDGRWPGLVAEKLFDNTFVPACSPHLGLRDVTELPHPRLTSVRAAVCAHWAVADGREVPG